MKKSLSFYQNTTPRAGNNSFISTNFTKSPHHELSKKLEFSEIRKSNHFNQATDFINDKTTNVLIIYYEKIGFNIIIILIFIVGIDDKFVGNEYSKRKRKGKQRIR